MDTRIRLEQINAATNTFKAYEISLTEGADGWAVSGWNGRIGKPLKEQEKGKGLPLDEAKKIFDALLKTQMKKGYLPVGEAAAVIAAPEGAPADPDLLPALPTAYQDPTVVTLTPSEWMAQEKHDGENRPGRIAADGTITLANRGGQPVPVPETVHAALAEMGKRTGPITFFSEDMGANGLVIFNIAEGMGVDRNVAFLKRNEALRALAEIVKDIDLLRVEVAVPLTQFIAEGREAELRANVAEGYVLIRADASFAAGRTNNPKTATMLKVKFFEDATFRISAGRPKARSVGIESWDADTGAWVEKGNVTIPANFDVPQPGTFADVRYLYAYEGGSVYLPIYKGPREGVGPEDCDLRKLKLKGVPDVTLTAQDDGPKM